MVHRTWVLVLTTMAMGLLVWAGGVAAQAEKADKPHEATQEELTAAVPALDDLHEVVFELWHEAYPEKDTELIKELLPKADELTEKLDAATLPGILRDKQVAWDEGKLGLKAALEDLHAAAEADDEEAMLKKTEEFHTAFERLVRTIRPVSPELDDFHQQLYKLYHYHMPEYDLPMIRSATSAMQERIEPLKESKLPERLADRQERFDEAVSVLASAVDDLAETVKKDDREAIERAVEKVHTAYQRVEKIFD